MRCVLVGNYGVGNIGDDALREYFLSAFPEIDWVCVSASPHGKGEVPRLPLGFRSFFMPWWRTFSAIRSADALVFGGGSLFTDIESVWACLLWRSYASVAVLFGTPYVLAFQGTGPWKTALGRSLARTTYRFASFVSVRDAESLKRVRELVPTSEPVLSFDPAFALFAAYPKAAPRRRTLAVIPRANSGEMFFARVSEKLKEGWEAVTVLLLEPQSEEAVALRMQQIAPTCRVVKVTSVSQLLAEVAASSAAIVQRYHGALAAAAMEIPVEIVPQAEGDKMDALRHVLGEQNTRDAWLALIESGVMKLREALLQLHS